MVRRAEQDMNGCISTVSMRPRGSSMMREPMMAGTLQPKPMTIGTRALPGSPRRRISRSIA